MTRSERARAERGASGRAAGIFARLERELASVPERIMLPRLLLIASTAALVCFGLVMIFSASSVEALSEQGDAAYFVKRQLLLIVLGLVFAVACARVDYHELCGRWLIPITVTIVLSLVAVRLVGSTGGGATRWIAVGPVRLQPSEFAKIAALLASSKIIDDYYSRMIDFRAMARLFVCMVGLPLVLILLQPDNGTTAIIVVMIMVVAVKAGFPLKYLLAVVGAVGVLAIVVVLARGYAQDRITVWLDPWADQFDTGYQLTRGLMAFGSGGLFGQGLGMSRMKYFYLPEAHNDFIFSIVGEELGLVGTLGLLALFFFLFYQGLQVARNASDALGRLIATGAVTLLAAQMFVNVMGVLGIIPLSGKPLPFISYGGSSIIACLGMVGVIVNVAAHSQLPETVHDERRRAMRLSDEDTGVGEAHVRGGSAGARARGGASVPLSSPEEARRGFRVVEGGSGADGARTSSGIGGRERIDLGPSPTERLRPESAPEVRSVPLASGRTGSGGTAAGRRSGDDGRFGRDGSRPSRRR